MKQLNSLISTLKSKLKRGRDDDDEDEYEDEDEEEVGEETEVSEVTSKKSKKSKPASDEDDEEEEDEEDEEDEDDEAEAKKKKRVRIMAIVVGALLVWIALDETVLKKTEGGDPAVVTEQSGGFKRPPKRVRKKKGDTPPTETAAAETPTAAATDAPIVAPPIETTTEQPAVVAATPAPKATEVAAPEPTVEENNSIVDENVASNPFIDSPKTNVGESVTELEVQEGQENPQPSADSSEMKDLVTSEIKKEYVAPPKYDQIGRGLVYNCAGKHWACVDKVAYFQCKDNYLHDSSEKKTIECYPSDVYASYDDCKTVQIHHINMVKEIDFCGGGE